MDTIYKVTIKQIDWVNDIEADIFSIENHTSWAFCFPCDFKEGEETLVHLGCLLDLEIDNHSF